MVDAATGLLIANAVLLLTGRFRALRRVYVGIWFFTLVPAVFLFFYTMHPGMIVLHLALFPAVLSLYLPVSDDGRDCEDGQGQTRGPGQSRDSDGDGYRTVPPQHIFEDVEEIEETYRQ